MARIRQGILGPVSGSVGTIVGASWKDIDYIRSKSSRPRGEPTPAQLDNQLKFSLLMNFISTMTELVNLTFTKYAMDMSESNAAFAYNYHNAITGTSPGFTIDYAKALVSRGDLANATGIAATVTNKAIHFTWTDNSGLGLAAPTDKAVLVAYCKNYNLTVFSIGAAVRSTKSATLDVANFNGFQVETWIAFLSEDGINASNSIYTGELTVS
ncbi:MAG TPA: DUF6266 family protein [Parafilimonas sp.]|nr:DUF6266 family protein [Parafilimonas sp.]